jgi:hypothetical protein
MTKGTHRLYDAPPSAPFSPRGTGGLLTALTAQNRDLLTSLTDIAEFDNHRCRPNPTSDPTPRASNGAALQGKAVDRLLTELTDKDDRVNGYRQSSSADFRSDHTGEPCRRGSTGAPSHAPSNPPRQSPATRASTVEHQRPAGRSCSDASHRHAWRASTCEASSASRWSATQGRSYRNKLQRKQVSGAEIDPPSGPVSASSEGYQKRLIEQSLT